MSVSEIILPSPQRKPYYLTIFLVLSFFALIFYFRTSLEDFSQPFTYVFVGVGLLALLSGRVETLILILLITTSTIFNLPEFGTVPIKIGDLFLSDVLLMLLMVGPLLKRVTVEMAIIPKPLGYPILVMIVIAFFSFVYATMGLGVPTMRAGIEFRTILYMSIFFLVYHYVKSHRQLKTLLLCVGLVALVVSGMLVVQYVIGKDVSIVYGRVEILNTPQRQFADVTRVMVPGSSIILFTLDVLIAIYILKAGKRKGRTLILPCIAFLSFGLILTFTRIFWVMVVGSTMLLLFLARRKTIIYPRMTFLLVCAVGGIALILQTSLLNSSVIEDAMLDRTISILKAPGRFRDDTLFVRYLESRYAWQKITENPLLGIGLGNSYRPNIFGNSDYERNLGGTNVHNGYLATQLKMGIAGSATFVWLMVVFFGRVLRKWKRVKDPVYQAVVLGIAVSIGGMLIHNLVASPFLTVFWVSIAAVAFGIVEKIFQLEGIA